MKVATNSNNLVVTASPRNRFGRGGWGYRGPVPQPPLNRPGGLPAARAAHQDVLPSDSTLAGLAVLGATGLGLAAANAVSGGRFGVPCLLHFLTGLDCPLCGTTRMAAAVLHGDLAGALRFNAPALLAILVVAYLWLSWVLERLPFRARLPRPVLGPRARSALLPAVVAAAVVFMVLRNLPWPPFTALHV
ncbi:Protein of unknown function [Actinopolymorpha singaporensis]|uniref:DUF2752 domain-containing protein n=1 Tax=Actinopolymorpha singaporensis TaxID=117157 RepID=A0A1H1X072_9ACTN|nr:Protein of unknown function [Actinopolymorpha singaporensis]